MKRAILYAALIIGVGAIGFPQEKVSNWDSTIWFSAGPTFGNYFMSGSNLENSYTGSPGINLSFYALFGERNIGLFFNYGILFPAIDSTGRNLHPSIHLDFILLGIGFARTINENMTLYFGAGPQMNMIFLHSREHAETKGDYFITLGLGGDVGLKFRFGTIFTIQIGTALSYNFAAYREIRRNLNFGNNSYDLEDSGWLNRFSLVGIRPYISFGFTIRESNLSSSGRD